MTKINLRVSRCQAQPVVGLTAAALLLTAGAVTAQHEPGHRVKRHAKVIQLGEEPGHHAVFLGELAGTGYIGVELLQLTPELRAHFGVPAEAGVMISRVVPDSPAAAAGLRVGDIVTAAGGERITSPHGLSQEVRQRDEGQELDLELWRDRRLANHTVTVAAGEHRLVDLRGHLEDLPELKFDFKFKDLERYLDGPDWQERVRRFESLDWGAIEERMREVEKRLRALEQELDQASPHRR